MFFSHLRQWLADMCEAAANVLAADTFPDIQVDDTDILSCDVPPECVTAIIYVTDGPEAYQTYTRSFPDSDTAEEWLLWLDQYGRIPSDWSHGVIGSTTAMRFNGCDRKVRSFCAGWLGSFTLSFRDASLELWDFTPDPSVTDISE